MAISSDYPRPITVNGYSCRNCDDVSKAKRFIDPAKPKFGVDPTSDAANDKRPAPSDGTGLRFDKLA